MRNLIRGWVGPTARWRRALGAALAATLITAGGADALPSRLAQQDSEDAIAATYYRALLLNTPYVESTWDAAAGTYRMADFYFVAVLGNAVLLKFGTYDEAVAGVSRTVLADHTVRTIRYAAARNRNVTSTGTWGKQIYWDATMESYFVAAAKLMWPDLDATTRSQVDTIIRGTANYLVSLGTGQDPLSGSWTTNGLAGGFQGDSKIEEMGNRTIPLATALAWLPGDASAASWRTWLTRWTTNHTGLRAADLANPTVVGGRPISEWNQAQNIWDTFIVENHGSYNPIYQQAVGGYPGHTAAQFLAANRPAAPEHLNPPNADRLWFTMAHTGTDAGVPQDFMVADRHHLYGRNVLPITARALINGDPYAARAEAMLAEHLVPYVSYPPVGRLTKFSGEPKYEPEARAELGMAYLLHLRRELLAGDVTPVSQTEYFRHFSTAVDYGQGPGLVVQQTVGALAAAVSKAGYVKFAYLPQHDDWLFDVAGKSPAFLPSVDTPVQARTAHAYTRLRDGIDATATALRTPAGVAGFTTLPDGTVVYATTGLAAREGALRLYNLRMPGVPGLDGDRTFTWAGGSATLVPQSGTGDGGVDEIRFPATTARYVRMSASTAATQYGFSLWELETYGGSGANLALNGATTASSHDSGNQLPPQLATDGRTNTRWAVAPSQRSVPGWLAVDLGAARAIDRVVLRWEVAYASAYRIEVSDDGQAWRTAATVPATTAASGNWLNVDGRAGFVVRGSTNPITMSPTAVTLSDGPAARAAGMVVEGYPAETAAETARHAAAVAPSDLPAGLAASLAGGHLSTFNLGGSTISGGQFTLPQAGPETVLYQGVQYTTGAARTRYEISINAADARVAPARFTLSGQSGAPVPAGLRIWARGSRTVEVTAADIGSPAHLTLRSLATGEERRVSIAAGHLTTVEFTSGLRQPTADLARGRTTFPTSPLPAGMTTPEHAVDGDLTTAWTPNPGTARMVVDLGAARTVGSARLAWGTGTPPSARVDVSTDGLTYRPLGTAPVTARYVAVVVTGWQPGHAPLTDVAVLPPGAQPDL